MTGRMYTLICQQTQNIPKTKQKRKKIKQSSWQAGCILWSANKHQMFKRKRRGSEDWRGHIPKAFCKYRRERERERERGNQQSSVSHTWQILFVHWIFIHCIVLMSYCFALCWNIHIVVISCDTRTRRRAKAEEWKLGAVLRKDKKITQKKT